MAEIMGRFLLLGVNTLNKHQKRTPLSKLYKIVMSEYRENSP